jgi:transcriptional regulator with XRE-family HTH domain
VNRRGGTTEIERLIAERGEDIAKFERRARLTPRSLDKVIAGGNPKVATARRIAAALERPIESLFGDDGSARPAGSQPEPPAPPAPRPLRSVQLDLEDIDARSVRAIREILTESPERNGAEATLRRLDDLARARRAELRRLL